MEAQERRLTTRQRLFVEFYLGAANGNAVQAARLAGYAVPDPEGTRLLKHPAVQELIRARVREAAMEADEVLARLAEHARATIADFIKIRDDGSWELDLKQAEERGRLHLLEEISVTRHGTKFKLVDTQAALEKLGRYHKLFTERHEFSGTVDAPICIIEVAPLSGRNEEGTEPDYPPDETPSCMAHLMEPSTGDQEDGIRQNKIGPGRFRRQRGGRAFRHLRGSPAL